MLPRAGAGAGAGAQPRRRAAAAADHGYARPVILDEGGIVFEDEDGNPIKHTPEQAAEHYHQQALFVDTRVRLCTNCTDAGVFYKEVDNVGRLQCRFHPGRVGDDGRYLCCTKLAGDRRERAWRGCTPCDHTTLPSAQELASVEGTQRWTDATMYQTLPLHLLHRYRPRPELVVERRPNAKQPEKATAVVLRVSPEYLERF